MQKRLFPWYVYTTGFVLLVFPMILARTNPEYAPMLSAAGAVILLPLLSTSFVLVIVPLVNHLRGVRIMPFDEKPAKMMTYAVLRVVVSIVGIYVLIAYVVPTWRGAYKLYALAVSPDTVTDVIEHQGSGLSFVPLVGTIKLRGRADEFIWVYGHYFPYSDIQEYTLTLLPGSNIVVDVKASDGESTTTAEGLSGKKMPKL
jgi:hypothetical protein